MVAQLSAVFAHRSHRHVETGAGSPDHVAVAVSVEPTCAVPLIDGPDVIAGATAARATEGASNANAATADAKSALTGAGCTRQPSIPADRCARRGREQHPDLPKWPGPRKSPSPRV